MSKKRELRAYALDSADGLSFLEEGMLLPLEGTPARAGGYHEASGDHRAGRCAEVFFGNRQALRRTGAEIELFGAADSS